MGQVLVRTDFPGANAIICEVAEGPERVRVDFAADPRNCPEALWFDFRVEGLGGRELTCRLLNAEQTLGGEDWSGNHPVYRGDAGAPGARGGVGENFPHVVGVTGRPAAARGAEPLWGGRQADAGDWLRCPSPVEEPSPSGRRSFAYTVPAGFETVEFAHCYPYQPEDLEKTLAEVGGVWQGEVLGYSHRGRPLWRYGSEFAQPGDPRPGYYLLARQHAGETPGSWVLDGLLRHLAADDSARAAAIWWVVPFVDIDDVVEGSYGKDPFPCDCNRAWHTIPLRTETKLLQADIARWTKCCRPCFLIDLHAPGHRERETYVHLPREGRSGQEYALVFDFARRFRDAMPGELRGEKWWERPTYPSRYTVGTAVTSWFYDTYASPGATVETSYQGTATRDHTISDYGRLGQALAETLVQLARERSP